MLVPILIGIAVGLLLGFPLGMLIELVRVEYGSVAEMVDSFLYAIKIIMKRRKKNESGIH